MKRPESTEYAPYYDNYISLINGDDVLSVLDAQLLSFRSLFSNFAEEKGLYRYAAGKWTCKESLSHVIETERIFGYRLLRVSRGDTTPMEGYEQNDYVVTSNANNRTFLDLLNEFEHQRRANLILINSLTEETTTRIGTASGNPVSARALVYMIAGHVRHHERIFAEQYLA